MAQLTRLVIPAPYASPGADRLAELRGRLGQELEELSAELVSRADAAAPAAAAGRGAPADPLQQRVRLLGQLIAGLATADPALIWHDRAGFGSTVLLRDLQSGEESFVTLMVGELLEIEQNQVSLGSPLGQALLGRRAGDEPRVQTPRGVRRFRVLAVHTLPQSVGMAAAEPVGAA